MIPIPHTPSAMFIKRPFSSPHSLCLLFFLAVPLRSFVLRPKYSPTLPSSFLSLSFALTLLLAFSFAIPFLAQPFLPNPLSSLPSFLPHSVSPSPLLLRLQEGKGGDDGERERQRARIKPEQREIILAVVWSLGRRVVHSCRGFSWRARYRRRQCVCASEFLLSLYYRLFGFLWIF